MSLQRVSSGSTWALYEWAPNTQGESAMVFTPTDQTDQERRTNAGFAAIREVDTRPVREPDYRRLMTQRPRSGTDTFWRRPRRKPGLTPSQARPGTRVMHDGMPWAVVTAASDDTVTLVLTRTDGQFSYSRRQFADIANGARFTLVEP